MIYDSYLKTIESAYTERYMGLPTEESNSHGYEQGSLLRKAKKLSGKRVNIFLAHGMADTNVHLQNSMVLAKELVRHNVTFQQQVIMKKLNAFCIIYHKMYMIA